MSIRDTIRDQIGRGQLFLLEPRMPDDPVVRTMVVSAEVQRLLTGPWNSAAMARRCGLLRAVLEEFVRGNVLAVCLAPHKARTAYMARLDKPADEVWDIRVRDPSPALRVFGRFGDTDLFVALLCAPRSVNVEWLPRPPLGDGSSREWQLAINECKASWRNLFPSYDPIHGANLHVYVSANAFLV